jgi:hypothetical protein
LLVHQHSILERTSELDQIRVFRDRRVEGNVKEALIVKVRFRDEQIMPSKCLTSMRNFIDHLGSINEKPSVDERGRSSLILLVELSFKFAQLFNGTNR